MRIKKYIPLLLKIIFSITLGVQILSGSYLLLIWNKISGTEFVALTVSTLIICLAITLIGNIEELSIGGNIIKLREAKEEAENALEKIQDTQAALFILMLEMSKNPPGGFSTEGPKDPRIDTFLKVFNSIKKSRLDMIIKNEIYQTVNFLCKTQFRHALSVSSVNNETLNKYINTEESINDRTLISIILSNYTLRNSENKDDKERLIYDAVNEYRKLLDIRNKYNNN
ncbi:hypothetical protein QCD60_23905 [Pokkaliibacter sp. MBI-7]|uniref:hypothetical protein n=1 Tax=Pokkaliibacter sp. MBI-7 TaxID=3040600 RepID=UPI00244D6956|nr:hypothetical protein [Pokkaliibacter sp. MBI-7]MDH2435573.1 hypothetical protein [Pokkaliibacter sp. MBI-7]